MNTFTFAVRSARRMPDPNPGFKGAERHIFLCAVDELPLDLPRTPNPREQNTDRKIYREIREHLLNSADASPNTFHLKNKGITLLAESVRRENDELYQVVFDDPHGIVDGGHTYQLISDAREEIKKRNQENTPEAEKIRQFVKVEVLVGYDPEIFVEIAAGLNTAVQVQQMALANLEGKFDWIRDELRGQPYIKHIAFTQNALGEDRVYDVRDIIGILELFNIEAYPNESDKYPVRAYTSKEDVLLAYLKNPDSYAKLRPILRDILRLYDKVSYEAKDLHTKSGGSGGHLGIMEKKASGKYKFIFINAESEFRLHKGALFPILGSLRCMVEEDPDTGLMRWTSPWPSVEELWQAVAPKLTNTSRDTFSKNRNVNALGKDKGFWQTLHMVADNQRIRSKK